MCQVKIFVSVGVTMSVSFSVGSVSFRTRWMRTRFPFQYGIASMTELPHVFGVMEGDFKGVAWRGLASEGLPPTVWLRCEGSRVL